MRPSVLPAKVQGDLAEQFGPEIARRIAHMPPGAIPDAIKVVRKELDKQRDQSRHRQYRDRELDWMSNRIY
jgi:hypothetical protein